MTTNRPEFKEHDDFIFEHKDIGKVTRKEFIKYIRSSHDHMRKLSQIIQQYNKTINDYFNEWDGNLDSFDDEVKDLLKRWISDGTMDHIINENLMSTKADKSYVDDIDENLMSIKADKSYVDDIDENLTAQLAETVRHETGWMNVKTVFGAVGNGINDDTLALKNGIQHCIDNNKTLYIPEGVYMIRSTELYFEDIPSGSVASIKGDGKNTLIKRFDGDVQENWSQLFKFRPKDEDGEGIFIEIEGLSFDGNARNNIEGDVGHTFEHSATISMSGNPNNKIKNIYLNNLYFTDPVADNIYIPGSADSYVDSIDISNFYATGRTQARSDITITGGVKNINISNATVDKLEVELNDEYSGGYSYLNIANLFCNQQLDLLGGGNSLYVNAVNVHAESFYIWSCSGIIQNSTLVVGDSRARSIRGGNVEVANTTFLFNVLDGVTSPLELRHYTSETNPLERPVNIRLDNCRFVINGTPIDNTSVAVECERGTYDDLNFHISNSWFDKGFEHDIYADRTNKVTIENCDIGNSIRLDGAGIAMIDILNSVYTLKDNTFNRAEDKPILIGNGGNLFLNIQNNLIQLRHQGFIFKSSNWSYVTVESINQTLTTDTPPDFGGFKGERVIEIKNDSEVSLWVCTKTHHSSATWVKIS